MSSSNKKFKHPHLLHSHYEWILSDRTVVNALVLKLDMYTSGRLYIAHLRQECHNSKFGIFELLV